MSHTPVKLYDDSEALVQDVTVCPSGSTDRNGLSVALRQGVWSLNIADVPILECRVNSG